MAVELDGSRAELVSFEPLVVKLPKDWAHFHSYGGTSRFFQGLAEERLLATRCRAPECSEHRLFLPPRPHCVECWAETEWMEVTPRGTIHTFSEIRYPGALFRAKAPVPLISVAVEGVCTKLMSYLKEGEPEIGMPVRAVFETQRPTNTILDLAWVPA